LVGCLVFTVFYCLLFSSSILFLSLLEQFLN
jgi:hypothetical protein